MHVREQSKCGIMFKSEHSLTREEGKKYLIKFHDFILCMDSILNLWLFDSYWICNFCKLNTATHIESHPWLRFERKENK